MSTPSNSPCKVFSPVKVSESPGVNVQGNLTGTPRKFKDMAADLFNLIQEWYEQHTQGLKLILQIRDLKINHLGQTDYPPGLEELCDSLSAVVNMMDNLRKKVARQSKEFQALDKLEKLNNSRSEPVFLSWCSKEYVDLSSQVATAMEKEYEIKNKIAYDVPHSTTEHQLLMHCSMWSSVSLDSTDCSLKFRVAAMLKETGHR